jgi:phosphatidylserine decarboxylase
MLVLVSSSVAASNHIFIRDAWIAEAPTVATNHAAYLILENLGQTTLDIISVTSPNYERVSVHRTMLVGDIARMEAIDSLTVPAGESITFTPGDFHLMLYNADRVLQAADNIPIKILFSDGSSIDFTAEVRRMSEMKGSQDKREQIMLQRDRFATLKTAYQHLLPQHFLSGVVYRLTRSTWGSLKNLMIKNYIRHFDVDMSVSLKSNAEDFEHFNAFFTRALRDGVRPIETSVDSIVSPVDGSISQLGTITGEELLQAKGNEYSLLKLLGGNEALAKRFVNGQFITLYLSPRDYHRIHMPVDGTLLDMTYVPGRLYSVSPLTTQAIDNLFARNERVINHFKTSSGSMALIMVGAIFVGSMETVWAGEITPARNRTLQHSDYSNPEIQINFDKGEEMGRFNMGSTVILLFEPGALQWVPSLIPGANIRLGQKLGTLKGNN